MKASLASTVALRNTDKAFQLANSYGLEPESHQELIYCLNRIISEQRDKGLNQIANIHPDRELILSTVNKSSNACGCSSADGVETSKGNDVSSPETTNKPTGARPSFVRENQTLLIMAGAVIAIAYLMKR